MDIHILYMYGGMLLATYSVIANDSIQTLGTFIQSTKNHLTWRMLWLGASILLIITLSYGWFMHSGDLSFGRLNRVPFQEVQWYHVLAPTILIALTRYGIPVSTSFLCLSAFSSSVVLGSMLEKSAYGYVIAAFAAFVIWLVVSSLLRHVLGVNDGHMPISKIAEKRWRIAQMASSGLLWVSWITHDMANITVFLPRQTSFSELIFVLASAVLFLGIIFRFGGGSIQRILKTKSSTQFVMSATLIDLVYATILIFFKEYNDIPMSTTWVFVGLLTGREVAIRTITKIQAKRQRLLPMVISDLAKISFGAFISVAIVLFIHNRWAETYDILLSKITFLEGLGMALIIGIMAWSVVHHHRESIIEEKNLIENH